MQTRPRTPPYEHQEPSSLDSDPASVIATTLKRTPGSGRERIVDPDNIVSPACAPEAYGGARDKDEARSNPITGEDPRASHCRAKTK